jgi:hypothetical protein
MLEKGCVNKHETKDIYCLYDCLFDVYELDELTAREEAMIEYMMKNGIGFVVFE